MRPALTDQGVRRDTARFLRGWSAADLADVATRLPKFDKPVLLAWAPEDLFFKFSFAERITSPFGCSVRISASDAEGVVYETSYNAAIRNNTFVRNAIAKGPTNPSFPAGAIYISESGSDPRVASAHNEAFDISGNVLIDNWAGVILWENSDRFAGSPANTSTGANTLVNPGVVTAETCNAENIGTQPYIDDCRWKTQNVHVHDNVFTFSPEAIGTACVTHSGCGYNGLFANWGTFPDWSPYHGETVQDAITFDQSNLFYENSYSGPWHFVIHGQGNSVDWATWQGAPYDQDADSVIKLGSEDGH
jgi:hypothetical protein